MTRHIVMDDGALVSGTQSIDRALGLLSLVGRAGEGGVALTRVVTQSGLNKPTARRLLVALIKARLVEQDPESRCYRLGREAYVLGTLAAPRHGLLNQASVSLRRLSVATGDASFVSARYGNYSVCLHREEGSHPLRTHALQTADQHPLGVGAGSLAILAALPEAERIWVGRELAAEMEGYPGYPPDIIVQDIRQAQDNGFALNPGRFVPGSWGIGVAVRFPDGSVAGALSIAAVESRLQLDRQAELVQLLKEEAAQVETRIAELFGPVGPSGKDQKNG